MALPQILLVDDDPECLIALSHRLRFAFRGQSLAVDVADCAASGLIAAKTARYDAVIVDIVMPGTNGFTFAEQLRRTQPGIPIIMITGWDVKSGQEQAERLGLVACLSKPIEFSVLCTAVKGLLEHKYDSPR
ncbi:response regulator transcription factor [Nitrospira sp. Nam74]